MTTGPLSPQTRLHEALFHLERARGRLETDDPTVAAAVAAISDDVERLVDEFESGDGGDTGDDGTLSDGALGPVGTTPDSTDPPETSLSLDEAFSLLSSRWRRYVLYSLFVYTTPVSLASVADTVTEFEHGVSADSIPDERLEVYMRLYHSHVPRLDAADVVDYDQSEDTVAPGPELARLRPLLERTANEELDGGNSWPFSR